MKDEIWTSRSGKKTPVGELHEEHVRNILRMILRAARQRREAEARVEQMVEKLAKLLPPPERGTPMTEWHDEDFPPAGCDNYGLLPDRD